MDWAFDGLPGPSGKPPSGFWERRRKPTPRDTAREERRPPATRAWIADAVSSTLLCPPRPTTLNPPSVFCWRAIQLTEARAPAVEARPVALRASTLNEVSTTPPA